MAAAHEKAVAALTSEHEEQQAKLQCRLVEAESQPEAPAPD